MRTSRIDSLERQARYRTRVFWIGRKVWGRKAKQITGQITGQVTRLNKLLGKLLERKGIEGETAHTLLLGSHKN